MKLTARRPLYRFHPQYPILASPPLLTAMNMFSYYLHRHAPGNVAGWDRLLRAVPAVATAVLFATGVIGGGLALGLGIASGMLLATSATGKCSIYYATGTGTRRDADGQRVSGRG